MITPQTKLTTIYANAKPINALREQGYGEADFDIDETVLSYFSGEGGFKDTSKKVIFRTDTGDELGVHGRDYKAVAPKKMIDTTRAILERSKLDCRDIQETIRTSHDGSRTFVQYKLPHHSYMTPDGDTASLGLLAVSSFDGTWPFMISAAAIQSACTNLQVFVGGEVAVFKAKHTRNLDIEACSRVITKALDVFDSQCDYWHGWYQTKTRDSEAFSDIVEALKIESAKKLMEEIHFWSPEEVMRKMPRRNHALAYIYDKYVNVYKKRLGSNKWALYNAFTDWSTHAPAQRKDAIVNMAATQSMRQSLVANYFNKAA